MDILPQGGVKSTVFALKTQFFGFKTATTKKHALIDRERAFLSLVEMGRVELPSDVKISGLSTSLVDCSVSRRRTRSTKRDVD